MIGIAQNDLRADLFQVFRRHGLDRGLGAHRHEDRGFDVAVQGGEPARAGMAFAGSGELGKGTWHGRL